MRDRTEDAEGPEGDDAPTTQRSKTTVQFEHKAVGVAIKLVSSVPGILDDIPIARYNKIHPNDPEPADWGIEKIREYEKLCMDFLYDTTKIKMTAMDSVAFAAATRCYICDEPFDYNSKEQGDSKVRDHDHISGDYRGAAHSSCNLKKCRQRRIPIFFHNLRGYDEHILIPALGKHKDYKLKIIGQTMEKYLMIAFG